MIKAVIFDKDGLMFDSERLQYQSFRDVLAEYGHKYTKEYHYQNVGRSGSFTYPWVQKLFKIKDIEGFIKKRRQYYRKLSSKNLKMFPGLLDLIQALKKEGYKLAVASGSHLQSIKQELDQYQLFGYFDTVLSSEGLPSKPSPEVFLVTAKELGVSSDECLVLEDSQTGVEAAKAAGMDCIAIPNEFTQHQDFSQADQALKSLKEVIAVVQTLKQSKQ